MYIVGLPDVGFVEAETHSITYCEINTITPLFFKFLILCLHHKGMPHIKETLKSTVLDKHLNMQYYNTKTNKISMHWRCDQRK